MLVVRHFPQIFSKSALGRGVGASIIDNAIHNPIFYIPTFYVYTDSIKGSSLESSLEHLKQEWHEVAATCAAMWVPLQILNFTVVPPAGRVAFVNAMNLIWNVVIDFLSHRGQALQNVCGFHVHKCVKHFSSLRIVWMDGGRQP